MREFGIYSPEDVIAENLKETEAREDTVCEAELAHLCELAAELIHESELPDLLPVLPDHRPPVFSVREELPQKNAAHLTQLRPLRRMRRATLFCRVLWQMLRQSRPLTTASFFQEGDPVSPAAAQRIVYQRSSYTDSAYLRLSSLLKEPRAAYAHSFLAACEEVYNGHCEYCILPVENSSEGQLTGFFQLIERYELKIAATCDVVGGDTGRLTRFALLKRNLLPLLSNGNRNVYFECFLPGEDAASQLSEILTAAQASSLSLHRAGFLPHGGEESTETLHLSFQAEPENLPPFLLYLAMEAPEHTPVGLYPHLQKKGR